MLSIAGENLATLAGQAIEIKLSSPAISSTVEIGIFDGDSLSAVGAGHWDYNENASGTPIALGSSAVFTLYADPNADGTGTVKLAEWLGSQMTDNDWWTVSVQNVLAAQSVGGAYVYNLVIELADPTTTTWNNFKVRTDGALSVLPSSFAFTAPLFSPVPERPGRPDACCGVGRGLRPGIAGQPRHGARYG
jgi:hypothetical protein